MASVLSRDLETYRAAVDRYNRQIKGYNHTVAGYNQTLVKDANGNTVVVDGVGNTYGVTAGGELKGATLPDGRSVSDYGVSPITGENRYQMLRQNPTSRNTETTTAIAVFNDNGQITGYQIPNSEGGGQMLGPEWRVLSQQGPTSEGGTPTYTVERDASVYADRPGDFTGKLTAKKPDPSIAQVRQSMTGTFADQERGGLISDVIHGKGVRQGAVAYRSGSLTPNPNPQTNPGNPPPITGQPPTNNANPKLNPNDPRYINRDDSEFVIA